MNNNNIRYKCILYKYDYIIYESKYKYVKFIDFFYQSIKFQINYLKCNF